MVLLKKSLLPAAFLFSCFVGSADADIYKYIDSEGVLHFTNVPTSSEYEFYLREGSVDSLSEPVNSHSVDGYKEVLLAASERHGLSVSLLKAIIKVESNFNPWAVSRKGAKGLMQIMPENIKAFRIKDPFNPEENIMAGTKYLKFLLNKFNGKLPLALAAYNAGPEKVDRYRRIPPIKETEDYVEKVMRYYYLYKKG